MRHALRSIGTLFLFLLCLIILGVIGVSIYLARSYLPFLGIAILVSIGVCFVLLIILLLLRVLQSIPKPEAIHIGQQGTLLVQFNLLKSLFTVSEYRPLDARSPRTIIEEAKPVIPSFSKLLAGGVIGMGKLVLGCYSDGTPRLGSWNDVRSFIVAGKSRSGKTVTMFFLVLQMLLNRALVTLCDPHYKKQTGLAHMLQHLHDYIHIAGTEKEITEAVMEFADELEQRINGEDCNIARVLVIDEWTRIARHKEASKQIIWVIQAISQEGAGYNMFLVLGGQLLNPRAIGSGEVLQSIHAAYIHRLDMKQSMHILQNSKEAKKTPMSSTCYT